MNRVIKKLIAGVMDDSIYSIAIRGGSEDDIYELTDSIDIIED